MNEATFEFCKSVIYMIYCNDQTIRDCYIGSSKDFVTRQRVHKYRSSKGDSTYKTYPVYNFIFLNGGWDNFSIKILEYYPCRSKDDLLNREEHWYNIIKPTLNKYVPRRTRLIYNRMYRIKNKDKIKKHKHEYHKRKQLQKKKNAPSKPIKTEKPLNPVQVIDKNITLDFQ